MARLIPIDYFFLEYFFVNFRNKPKAGLSTNSGGGHKVSKNHNAFLVT